MHNKRIFISGGAGIIGTALVHRLLELGADLFIGDLKSCPKAWLGKVKYRQGDLNTLTKQELMAFDPEIVFHLAAPFERPYEPYSFFEENFHHHVQLSHHLMQSLQEIVSLERVVFASSYLVYDPASYQFSSFPAHAQTLTENSQLYPSHLDGAAKLFHEMELRFLAHLLGEQISFVSARIFRVYGFSSSDLISRGIRAALRHESLQIPQHEVMSDYIFVEDVAEGLVRLATIHERGVINLGSGHARSTADIIQILRGYFPALQIDSVASHLPFEAFQASIERWKEWTDWLPSHSLEKAIPKIIDFEQAAQKTAVKPAEHPAVLITSISKKMPLLKAVRTAAHKLGHFQKIHGCDSDAFCLGQYGVDEFWHCPRLEEMTAEQVVFYCHRNKITALIPTRDGELEFYAHHLDFFHQQGIYPMVSSLETLSTCLDKKNFADVLLHFRFPVIPSYLSLDEFEASFYAVKERRGAGSQQIGLGLNRHEALMHSQHLQEPIFQPYIQGQEWSVDLYRSLQGRVKGCVARQRNQVVQGESQVTTTMHYPLLEHLCQAMADRLNLYGHAVFQLLENEKGEFQVIECNPRFGGASTASLAVGLDSFFWFFAECLGVSLHDYPFMRHQGEIRQVRYPTDRILPWSSYLT